MLAECDVRFLRRSGPGGQNRNKVETAAILTHRPTGLSAEANERRSQAENRAAALWRLRMKLAVQVRHAPAAEDEPSELWRSRCRARRIVVNPEHDDLPALIGEALDAVAECGYDVAAAGDRMGASTSQMVKLLSIDPRALEFVNARRAERGLRALTPR